MFLEGTPFPTKEANIPCIWASFCFGWEQLSQQTANQVDKLQAHILCMYFLTKQLNFWKVWFFVYIQFHYLRNVLIHQKESKVNAWHARLRNGESESTQDLLCFHLPLRLEAQIYCRSHHRWTATNWFPKTHWDMTGSYEIIPTFLCNFISMHSLNSDQNSTV